MVDSVRNIQTINNLPEPCKKYLTGASANIENKPDTVEISAKNQDDEKKEKKPKNKKSLIASLALGGAILITLLGTFKKTGVLNKFNKTVREFAEKHTGDLNFTKAKKTLQQQEPNVGKVSNVMNNFTNLKDCVMMPVWEKIPGLRWMSHKSSEVYEKTGVAMAKKGYQHAMNLYQSFDSKIKNVLDSIKDPKIKKEVQELLEKRNALLNETFSPEKVRIDDIKKIMNDGQGLSKKTRDSFLEIFKKAKKEKSIKTGIKGLTSNFVAEDLVAARKQQFISPLKTRRNEISKIDDMIVDLLQQGGKENYLNNSLEAITSSRLNAMKGLNKAIRTEGNDLFDKMRDIIIGCAPTDIAGNVMTAGLMGVYMAQADDKNQRVEVALTSGIPLVLGLGTTSFATLKMYTGMKPLLMGMATTLVANTIGKIANKQYQKNHNVQATEPDIPTLDKTAKELTKKAKNIKKRADEYTH